MRKKQLRLVTLDGIRGIAIIAVFLGHSEIPYHFFPSPFPSWISLVINQTIFGSGFLGVALLFILSGFLMMYLYPKPENSIKFIQKRYTRIFPLFITMCSVSFFLTFFPHIPWYSRLGILFSFALIAHTIWVDIVKKARWNTFSLILFLLFLFMQFVIGIIACIFSSFYNTNFFNHLPLASQILASLFVHATLTFPLAGSIPIFNTLYWTLTMEILFYLLYPSVLAPIFNARFLQSNKRKFYLLVLLIPLSYFAYTLSYSIQSLRFMQLHLFFHFFTGMTLGSIYRQNHSNIKRLGLLFHKKIYYYLPIVLCIITFATYHASMNAFPAFHVIIQILSAIPLTFLIAVTLNDQTSLAKILSNTFIVFIGNISFSIYLSHLIVYSLVYSLFDFKNPNKYMKYSYDLFLIVVAAIITICIAYILYQLLEKPYFAEKEKKGTTLQVNLSKR